MSRADTPILEARGVSQHYPLPRTKLFQKPPVLTALEDVDFALYPGESVGIVGESGSGKTTLCRILVGQEAPTQGQLLFDGRDVWGRGFPIRELRKAVQMVFQSPRSSFDPRMRVGDALRQPLEALKLDADPKRRIAEVLDQVGLNEKSIHRFPHEFSGGQLQRLAIARALIPNPKVLIADEPVSALDVSIQAQVLNLLKDLVRDLGLTLAIIAHDLSVVGYTTSRVVVVSDGRIVEQGPPSKLFITPEHPMTRRLVDAVLTVQDGLSGHSLDDRQPL